jgi:hypothetical protein
MTCNPQHCNPFFRGLKRPHGSDSQRCTVGCTSPFQEEPPAYRKTVYWGRTGHLHRGSRGLCQHALSSRSCSTFVRLYGQVWLRLAVSVGGIHFGDVMCYSFVNYGGLFVMSDLGHTMSLSLLQRRLARSSTGKHAYMRALLHCSVVIISAWLSPM